MKNLTPTQLETLCRFLEKQDCDHTLGKTELWLSEHIETSHVQPALSELRMIGGYCDCEVIMNVPAPDDWQGTQEEYEDNQKTAYEDAIDNLGARN